MTPRDSWRPLAMILPGVGEAHMEVFSNIGLKGAVVDVVDPDFIVGL